MAHNMPKNGELENCCEGDSDLSDEDHHLHLEPKALEVIYGALQTPESSPPEAHKTSSEVTMRLPTSIVQVSSSTSNTVQPEDMSIRIPSITSHSGQGDMAEPEIKRRRLVYCDPITLERQHLDKDTQSTSGTLQNLQSVISSSLASSLTSLSDLQVSSVLSATSAATTSSNLSSFNTLAALASSMTNLSNQASNGGPVLSNLLRNCDGCQVKEQLITELLGMLRAKQLELETLRKMYAELLPGPEIIAYMRRLISLGQATHSGQPVVSTPPQPQSPTSVHVPATTIIKQQIVPYVGENVTISASPELSPQPPDSPDERNHDKVKLHEDYEVYLPHSEIENSLRKGKGSATAVLRYLMDVFYDNYTLAESSLTGEGKIKKKLDPQIMGAIKAFVRFNFPDIRESLLNAAATDKCVQARRLLVRKQQLNTGLQLHRLPQKLVNIPQYSAQILTVEDINNPNKHRDTITIHPIVIKTDQ